jgi:hypothetical protein
MVLSLQQREWICQRAETAPIEICLRINIYDSFVHPYKAYVFVFSSIDIGKDARARQTRSLAFLYHPLFELDLAHNPGLSNRLPHLFNPIRQVGFFDYLRYMP